MTDRQVLLAAIPSPSQGVWQLGPFPVRAYALCILAGIALAIWLTARRWRARGGDSEAATNVAFWAVPFGIVGGRLYHVLTSPDAYFGTGGHPIDALKIWHGGLGIWGAVAFGAVGAWIGCRRERLSFVDYADALAPGLLLAQAIGRWGNWFNVELFGRPTTLPWGLEVPADVAVAAGYPAGTLFHPTFLYEFVWNLAGVVVILWAERRFRLRGGQVFWLYVLIYTTGRLWIEMLRIDTAHHVFGVRLNVWTSVIVGIGALTALVVAGRRTQRPDAAQTVSVMEPEPNADAIADPGDP